MTIKWERLLTKKDGSGNRHIYGIFTIEKKASLFDGFFPAAYVFWGKEGHQINIRYCYSVMEVSGLMIRKKKEGYIEMTEGQLKGRWNWDDLRSQCEQFLTIEILKG